MTDYLLRVFLLRFLIKKERPVGNKVSFHFWINNCLLFSTNPSPFLCCPQGLSMCTCGLLSPSSKSSSGSATSTAAWIPLSIPATAASSSWPSFGSWGATANRRNAPAGEPTTTAPPPSAPLETHGKAPQITPAAGWMGASAPCRPLPAPAPATWVRASPHAQKGKHCTFGEPRLQPPPHPTCCLAAQRIVSRKALKGTAGRGKQLRGPLEACFLSPLGTLKRNEGSTGT